MEPQILPKVNIHHLLRALRPTLGVVHHGLLANCKADHGRVTWPVSESRRDPKALGQDLLENVLGGSSAHCNRRAAAFDPRPGDEVPDGEVVGVVGVGWEEVEAVEVVR